MASGTITKPEKHYITTVVTASSTTDFGAMFHNLCAEIRSKMSLENGECVLFSMSAQIPGQSVNAGPYYGIAFKTSSTVFIGKMYYAGITTGDHINWRDNSTESTATYEIITEGNKFMMRGSVQNNSDLNDVLQTGMYSVSSTYTIANKPSSDFYFLLVFRSSINSLSRWQVGFGLNAIYYRNSTDNTFTAWKKITATAVS